MEHHPSPSSTDPDRLVGIARIAARFDVSPDTVRRWWRANRFPKPIRVAGGHLRWRESDIAKYIADLA
jgi:predicted DNA-binding transcriptional regulator AlpA